MSLVIVEMFNTLQRFLANKGWNIIQLRISRYGLGIAAFYLSLAGSAAVILGTYQYDWLATLVIHNPTRQFYPESLLLMIQLVGFVFVIVVFLIQNTTQAFSINLSREVLRDPHLIIILLCFVGYTAFNVTGIYLAVSGFFVFLSYVFSISSLGLLLSLTLIVSHYLDVSNILESHNKKVIASIDANRLFSWPEIEDGEEHERLRKEAEFYTNIALESIENRQYETADTCIQSLENLGTVYLNEVTSPVEKDFVQDLNDQLYFLTNELGDDYAHQKNLEKLTESIGMLGRETYRNTQNDQQTLLWLKSLREIFELTADELDRTRAYGLSITEINQIILLHLSNTKPHNLAEYSVLIDPLDQIAEFPLDNRGHDRVIQKCLVSYKWQLITILNSHVTERFTHSKRDVEQVVNRMFNLLSLSHNSSNVQDSLILAAYFRLDSLYSHVRYYGLYGANPNVAALASQLTQKPPKEADIQAIDGVGFDNQRYEQATIELFGILVQFQKEATKDFVDTNMNDCFPAFAELAFIIHEDLLRMVNQKDEVKRLGIQVTKDFCEALEKRVHENNGRKPTLASNDYFADMLVLLYYYHYDDDVTLMRHMVIFLGLYQNLRSQYSRDEVKWLYRYLKWFGAIIHNTPNLEFTREIVNHFLIQDFYEPRQHRSRTIVHELEGTGYPVSYGDGLPSLSSKQIWKIEKPRIQGSLPGYKTEKCLRFHRYLKRRHKWV